MHSMLKTFLLVYGILSSDIKAQRRIEVHTIKLSQDPCIMNCLSGWTYFNYTCLRVVNETMIWIEAENGRELWMDGSQWDYHNRLLRKPVNGSRCQAMKTHEDPGFWTDDICGTNQYPFVCMYLIENDWK